MAGVVGLVPRKLGRSGARLQRWSQEPRPNRRSARLQDSGLEEVRRVVLFLVSSIYRRIVFLISLSVNKETNFLIKENIASLKSFIILKSPRS